MGEGGGDDGDDEDFPERTEEMVEGGWRERTFIEMTLD